jgi:hypothetical protein
MRNRRKERFDSGMILIHQELHRRLWLPWGMRLSLGTEFEIRGWPRKGKDAAKSGHLL